MFTVLIRYQGTRREVLLFAERIEFAGPEEKEPGLHIDNSDVEGKMSHFLAHSKKGDENWRDVFVMNDHGQTVARYIL